MKELEENYPQLIGGLLITNGDGDVNENGQKAILGFHMRSPKLKLRNYRFFWDSEFHEVLQYLNTFI